MDGPRRQAFGIDGCTAVVEGEHVTATDRFKRPRLIAVHAEGRRETLTLRDGRSQLALEAR